MQMDKKRNIFFLCEKKMYFLVLLLLFATSSHGDIQMVLNLQISNQLEVQTGSITCGTPGILTTSFPTSAGSGNFSYPVGDITTDGRGRITAPPMSLSAQSGFFGTNSGVTISAANSQARPLTGGISNTFLWQPGYGAVTSIYVIFQEGSPAWTSGQVAVEVWNNTGSLIFTSAYFNPSNTIQYTTHFDATLGAFTQPVRYGLQTGISGFTFESSATTAYEFRYVSDATPWVGGSLVILAQFYS